MAPELGIYLGYWGIGPNGTERRLPNLNNYNGVALYIAKAYIINHIVGLFGETQQIATSDIWVTETGCGSWAPFGLRGQADVLRTLNQQFAALSRCKGVILHRFRPGPEEVGTAFETFALTDNALNAKQPAQTYLSQDWAGAP